jgi:hypothetical protein
MISRFLLLTFMGFLSATSFASKEYEYNFQFKGEKLNAKIEATNPDEAYEKAVRMCMKAFSSTGKLTESAKLDLVDSCANPKS